MGCCIYSKQKQLKRDTDCYFDKEVTHQEDIQVSNTDSPGTGSPSYVCDKLIFKEKDCKAVSGGISIPLFQQRTNKLDRRAAGNR